MKKFLSFVLLLLCLHATYAQTLPFQGVARDSNGVLIPNRNMSVRISILDGSSTGTVVYQETQAVTTNNLGLFTLGIGGGTVVTGTFGDVAWGSASKFVQLEVDPTGGTSYTNLGASQLQSVPYALYALNSAGGAGSQPNKQIPYGTGSGLTSDADFKRDPDSHKTVIANNVGSQGGTMLRIDTAKASINYHDIATNNSSGVFAGPAFPDWNLNSICVASIVYDDANHILYGFYAVADSSEMTTGSNQGGAVVGTKLYSAFLDVAMKENPNSPFNSLTLDTNGLHYMYNDTDRYSFSNYDGTAGQVLTTNGAGILSFTSLPTPTANAWNAHQILTGTGNATDSITIQTGKNNIYNSGISITSLVVNLPGSPADGDMFILTLNATVGSISFQNGTVSSALVSIAAGLHQNTYTYDAATSTWY